MKFILVLALFAAVVSADFHSDIQAHCADEVADCAADDECAHALNNSDACDPDDQWCFEGAFTDAHDAASDALLACAAAFYPEEDSCVLTHCLAEYDACLEDSICEEAIFCHIGCMEEDEHYHSECEHQCFSENADAVSDNLLLCMAHNGCSDALSIDEDFEPCVQDTCGAELDACADDENCSAFLACKDECHYDFDCYEQCFENHANEVSAALTACAAACEPRDEVEQCIQANCDAALVDCANDEDCHALLECRHYCTDDEFPHACEAGCSHDYFNDAAAGLQQCIVENACDPEVFDLSEDDLNCAADNCGAELGDCGEDEACAAALGCIDTCGPSSQCIEACWDHHHSEAGNAVRDCVSASGCFPEAECCWMSNCGEEIGHCDEHYQCANALDCRHACAMEGHHDDHCVAVCFDAVHDVEEAHELLECGADAGCYTPEHHGHKKHHSKHGKKKNKGGHKKHHKH